MHPQRLIFLPGALLHSWGGVGERDPKRLAGFVLSCTFLWNDDSDTFLSKGGQVIFFWVTFLASAALDVTLI